jgi:hypothetical protein
MGFARAQAIQETCSPKLSGITPSVARLPPLRARTRAAGLLKWRLAMSDDSDLRKEQRGIVRRLLDAAFGRSELAKDEDRGLIHRLGTIKRRLDDDDDD